jgi:hypothetical protein
MSLKQSLKESGGGVKDVGSDPHVERRCKVQEELANSAARRDGKAASKVAKDWEDAGSQGGLAGD